MFGRKESPFVVVTFEYVFVEDRIDFFEVERSQLHREISLAVLQHELLREWELLPQNRLPVVGNTRVDPPVIDDQTVEGDVDAVVGELDL